MKYGNGRQHSADSQMLFVCAEEEKEKIKRTHRSSSNIEQARRRHIPTYSREYGRRKTKINKYQNERRGRQRWWERERERQKGRDDEQRTATQKQKRRKNNLKSISCPIRTYYFVRSEILSCVERWMLLLLLPDISRRRRRVCSLVCIFSLSSSSYSAHTHTHNF